VGARNPQQLTETLAAGGIELPESAVAEIQNIMEL
jgi:aryl-alcohol dehydrogenase-like predicted oxidoreductase